MRQNEALQNELEGTRAVIKKYETRIAEQHADHCASLSKLADYQQLKVFANVFNEKILDGHGNEMEYEDMSLLLEEKLQHTSCRSEVDKLEQQVKTTIYRLICELATRAVGS